MRHFIDTHGKIYGIDEGQEALIQDDWVEITEEEVLERLKPTIEQAKAIEEQQAKAYLDSTDWYVVRFSETGVPIPEEVSAKRAAARLVCPSQE